MILHVLSQSIQLSFWHFTTGPQILTALPRKKIQVRRLMSKLMIIILTSNHQQCTMAMTGRSPLECSLNGFSYNSSTFLRSWFTLEQRHQPGRQLLAKHRRTKTGLRTYVLQGTAQYFLLLLLSSKHLFLLPQGLLGDSVTVCSDWHFCSTFQMWTYDQAAIPAARP